MKKLFRAFKILLVFIVLVILAVGCGASWFFYRATPDYAGNKALPGLSAPVSVVHDEHGVPHIFADNNEDAIRTLGYLHASERLFQMEMQRRAGQGRLSEIIGADTLNIDKFVRALQLYSLAESSVASLSPDAQKFFQAYADGVNAWLTTHQNALPPEMMILGIKPEPWKIADSVVWGKLMALQLSKNYASEILRLQLSKKLNTAQMSALFAAVPAGTPITTEPSATSSQPEAQNFSSQIAEGIGHITGLDRPASNEWVISGDHTESGKPILANDPHLGLDAPVLWYLARIVTPGFSMEGATVPGLPVVLLGQNDHIAWGFTTTGSDVEDLFIETLDLKNPNNYLTAEGSTNFTVRSETIHVKDQKDVVLQIRSTRHGPVLSDIDPDLIKLAGKDKIVALAFTGLGAHDTTSEALMLLNRAESWQDFQSALKLYQCPPQNIVFADTAGNIGFITPGFVPIRKAGNGTLPVDGASGAYEWTGFIPLAEVPQVYNPKAGFIFNANNNVAGASYPYFMGVDWEEPWRAERIQQLITATDKHTLDSSAAMQADHTSLAARALLPFLLAQKAPDARAVQAMDLLRKWDGTMDKARPEPLIFEAWLYEMHKNLLENKTGFTLEEKGPYAATSIEYILQHDGTDWCATDDCSGEIVKALEDALNFITQRDGPDITQWQWGHEHFAVLRHKFYSHIPVLRDWTNLDIPSSGDFYTLDRGGSAEFHGEYPFGRTHGGGFRGLYDLNDPSQSRFMITTGESGHIFSPHYGDLVKHWNNVESFTLTGSRDDLVKRGLPELKLLPQ